MKKIDNRQWFIWFRVIVVWLSYIPFGLWLTRQEFSLDFYYSTLNLSDNIRQNWYSENFHNLLVSGLISVGVVMIMIFRYRFRIADNFMIKQSTAVIGIICLIISIGSLTYAHYNYGYSWQFLVGESIKLLLGVSVFEELIFRGFITNEIFRLKKHGIKTYVGIVISAILFGFMHLPAYFLYNEISIGGAIFRFIFPTIIGLAYATILYYKKDIISLILIHTASNICGSIAGQPFDIIFFVLMCLYALILIPAVKRHLPFKKNALI